MVTVGRPYQEAGSASMGASWKWDLEKKPAFIIILAGIMGALIGYGLDVWTPTMVVYPELYLSWAGLCIFSGILIWFSAGVRVYQKQITSSLLVLGYLSLILIGFINNLPLPAVALLAAAQLLMALSFNHWVEYFLFTLISLGVYLFCVLNLSQFLNGWPLFMGLMASATFAGGLFTWWRVGKLDPETPADQLISHLMDQDEDAMFLMSYDGERVVFQNYAAIQFLVQMGLAPDIEGADLLAKLDISNVYLQEHMQDTAPSTPEKQYLQTRDAQGNEVRLELVLSKLPLPDASYYRLKIIDITQRVEREYSIRRSLGIHQSLMFAMPDLIISMDGEDNILTLHAPKQIRNRVKLNTFEGQPLKRLIQTFLKPDDQERVLDLIDRARRTGQLQELDFQFGFESEELHFELRLMKMQSGDELLGILRDITVTRRTAMALQRSEDNFQEVFNSSKGGMMILDQETFRPVDVNTRAALLLGYESEKLLNSSLLDLIEVDDFTAFTTYLEQALDHEPQHFDTRLIGQDGRAIEVEMHIKHTRLDGIERLMVIFEDIADQIHKRKALAESELKYRALVENMNEGLILTDPDERILFVNRRMQEVLGLSEEEILGKTSYELLGQGLNEELIQEKSLLRRAGESDEYELRFVRRDEREVWLLVSGAPYMDHQGRTIGSIAIITDISDRKTTEKKLTEKKNELDSFIYKASHDLRGPLASIIGVTNIAKGEVNEEKANRYLDLIGRSTKKLDIILGELLDATRINHQPVNLEPVNVAELVETTLHELEQLIEEGSVELQADVPKGLQFMTDPYLLQSMLQNLVINGITYADPEQDKPYVKVTVKPKSGGRIELKVKDNGIGIADRIKPKIFEIFYRGHNQSNGSGLGLYIVKTACEKLGGEVSFTSTEGEGSTFSIKLPLPVHAMASN